jgi:hypothetical protein
MGLLGVTCWSMPFVPVSLARGCFRESDLLQESQYSIMSIVGITSIVGCMVQQLRPEYNALSYYGDNGTSLATHHSFSVFT